MPKRHKKKPQKQQIVLEAQLENISLTTKKFKLQLNWVNDHLPTLTTIFESQFRS